MNALHALASLARRVSRSRARVLAAPAAGSIASPTAVADEVTRAVESGLEAGAASAKPERGDIDAARRIFAATKDLTTAPAALEGLLELVRRFPSTELFQSLTAKVYERIQDGRVLEIWRGVDKRFPNSREGYLRLLRWTIRLEGLAAGEAMHAARFDAEPTTPRGKLVYALGYIEMKAFDEAEKLFGEIVAMQNVSEQILIDLGRTFLSQREPVRAGEICGMAKERFGETTHVRQLQSQVEVSLGLIRHMTDDALGSTAGVGGPGMPRAAFGSVIIRGAFEIARRVPVRWRDGARFIGPVVMINGSLGSGGAERQFVNTAIGLHRAAVAGEAIGGADIVGPVRIVCRSLHSRAGAGFFAPALTEAGLRVFQYADFPYFGGRPRWSCARETIDLLAVLPAQMVEGVTRLADVIRHVDPDIVHIWQDGSVLAAGLAAVLSGAPNIVLSVRTLPPADRFERNKPEYEATYRALMSFDTVTLSANSQIAATRYEEWLELPKGSVHVIPNGLALPAPAPSPETARLAADFAVPADAFVVGSVMRLDENKRPLLWLDVAMLIAAREPRARFIIVGDGPLLARARSHAAHRKIDDKVLFVGRSQDVSFWLQLMDAFLLLSRHEGLPNVLIEAEMAGVPVVSTPAGGAAETMEVGVTGTLLDSNEDVSTRDIADAVLGWRRDAPEERQAMRAMISQWATERFSIARMLELTADTYAAAARRQPTVTTGATMGARA